MPTISNADFIRIKSSLTTTPSSQTNSSSCSPTSKRHTLKKLSDDRVSRWTDTLASQHQSRLEWKKRHEDENERRRQIIDEKERLLKEQTRQTTINRAAHQLYERRDDVKNLRSVQSYALVVEGREEQISDLRERDRLEKEKEKRWHEDAMTSLRRAEEMERRKESSKKITAREGAALLKRQRDELERERSELLRKQKDEETRFVSQLQRDDASRRRRDKDAKRERIARERRIMDDLRRDVRIAQEDRSRKEREEAERRAEEWRRVDERTKARNELVKKHFDEKQKLRKMSVDTASEKLELRSKDEAVRLLNQRKQLDEKAKAKDEEMVRKRREWDKAIHESRQEQMALAREKREREREDAARNIREQEEKMREEEERAKKKQREKKELTIRIKKEQERQIEENRKKIEKEKEDERIQAIRLNEMSMKEDSDFRDFAMREIEAFRKLGKKTHMLERAVAKTKDVLAPVN